jgi:nicotinate-nucleotide adenylyltransferase
MFFIAWLQALFGRWWQPTPDKDRVLRIGLSMGTFNPIHLWHMQVAQCAWVQFLLDFVLFIPNGQPPHKDGVVDKELRFRMVKGSIWGNPKFRASRIELDRDGKSYTVDTLRQLIAEYSAKGYKVQLYLIVGMDNLDKIHLWHESPEILKLCKLLIAPRNSRLMTVDKIAELFPGYKQGEDWDIIDCPDSDISSTIIRDWYAKGLGACADYLVSNYARRTIKRFGLFSGKKAA